MTREPPILLILPKLVLGWSLTVMLIGKEMGTEIAALLLSTYLSCQLLVRSWKHVLRCIWMAVSQEQLPTSHGTIAKTMEQAAVLDLLAIGLAIVPFVLGAALATSLATTCSRRWLDMACFLAKLHLEPSACNPFQSISPEPLLTLLLALMVHHLVARQSPSSGHYLAGGTGTSPLKIKNT